MEIPWGDGPHYCAGAESYGCEAMLDEDEGSYCDECLERSFPIRSMKEESDAEPGDGGVDGAVFEDAAVGEGEDRGDGVGDSEG